MWHITRWSLYQCLMLEDARWCRIRILILVPINCLRNSDPLKKREHFISSKVFNQYIYQMQTKNIWIHPMAIKHINCNPNFLIFHIYKLSISPVCPPPHTGLEPWEVNLEILKIGLKFLCLMFNNTHERCDTFSKIFAHILEIYYWNFEIFTKNALTRSVFELEECFFFLNGSEFRKKLIGTIIRVLVRQQTLIKTQTS